MRQSLSRLAAVGMIFNLAGAAVAAGGLSVSSVDVKTYRRVVLEQRQWSLEDQKNRLGADLTSAATSVQSSFLFSMGDGEFKKSYGRPFAAIGCANPAQIVPIVEKASVEQLEKIAAAYVHPEAFSSFGPFDSARIVDALQKAVIARRQLDSVDAQLQGIEGEIRSLDAHDFLIR